VSEESGGNLGKFWEKVSDTVVKGVKASKEELVRTSRMGKIRLDISSIKNRIVDKQKELGQEVYRLWLDQKISLTELEHMFSEIKQLETQIKNKEKEIEKLAEEKEETAGDELKSTKIIAEEKTTPEGKDIPTKTEEEKPLADPKKKK
jgi:hypothetical protein